jgi:hypothetical protein
LNRNELGDGRENSSVESLSSTELEPAIGKLANVMSVERPTAEAEKPRIDR